MLSQRHSRLVFLIIGAAVFMWGQSALSAEKHKFTAVTKGKVGMKDGDDFYQLGMREDAFIKKFGKPDDRYEALLVYRGDGLLVTINDANEVDSFLFAVQATPASSRFGVLQAANVSTDRDANKDSRYRDIVKIYGEAKHEKEWTAGDGSRCTTLTYDFGNFFFVDGILSFMGVGEHVKS